LDKFFAPIRDVDWDEPEESSERAPQESHVEVRSEEAPEVTQELLPTEMPPERPEEDAVGGEPDDAWYDSGALEPIDDILGEPPAVEVGADLDRRGPQIGERDVPAAFMTGVLLAGVALAALWAGPAAFAVVAGIAVLVAQGELFGVMVKAHNQPATLVGLVAG